MIHLMHLEDPSCCKVQIDWKSKGGNDIRRLEWSPTYVLTVMVISIQVTGCLQSWRKGESSRDLSVGKIDPSFSWIRCGR